MQIRTIRFITILIAHHLTTESTRVMSQQKTKKEMKRSVSDAAADHSTDVSSSSQLDVVRSVPEIASYQTVLNITISKNEHKEKYGKQHKTSVEQWNELSKLLSPIYAILLTLIGLVFPITEALRDAWLDTVYNMIYISYTLSISTVFIIYLQLHLLYDTHRHGNHDASEDDDQQSHETCWSSNEAIMKKRSDPKYRRQSVDFEAAVVRMTDTGGLLIQDADAAASRRSISNGDLDASGSTHEMFNRSNESGITSPGSATVSFIPTGKQLVKRSDGVRPKDSVTATLHLRSTNTTTSQHRSASDASSEEEVGVWIDLSKLGTVFSHQGSNTYLRAGALVITLGNLIYIGLEIESRMHPSTRHCSGRFGWTYIIRLIFVVFQTFFIFKNSSIQVRRNEYLVRLGLMHTIATNMSVWLRTLVSDTLIGFKHAEIQQQLASADNSTPVDDICVRVDENAYKASDHLFPFVLEYSLIAMGILIMMYKSIGQEHDKRSNVLRGIQNLFKIRALEMSSTNELYGDNYESSNASNSRLNKSHRGLFAGVIMLTGCIIAILLYFLDTSDSQPIIYLATEMSVNVLLLVTTVVAVAYLRQLSYIARLPSIDDLLLMLSMCGAVLFETAIIMSSGNFLTVHAAGNSQLSLERLRLSTAFISAIQIILQALLTCSGMRRYPSEVRHVVDMPGRGFITFLVIGNVTVWILRTALANALTTAAETEYYGTITWLLLLNISLPLSLFFRFHSSVCLADIWHTAYTSPVRQHRHRAVSEKRQW